MKPLIFQRLFALPRQMWAKAVPRDVRKQPLVDSSDHVAQAVKNSSAFVQSKKQVERYPFLTVLLGPSMVRKLFGW
ncbi:hypothetical protein DBV14_07655 [Variovorax sp. KBW07]|uniref:hypothetical protein n=1 Tax=Variovorax sp. KBW07 TaxID=2153358 RepID=UPI000F58C1BC|nr:hypothetical protein [Variovorax sp. KBW07]RQO59266.1 hypothetical protein DBV14_07655 [Variovorax sp. KBW07]